MSQTLDELRALRDDLALSESAGLWLGLPVRWVDHPAVPKFRCTTGHVRSGVLKTEERGDACLACGAPALLTFPEDVDDPKASKETRT